MIERLPSVRSLTCLNKKPKDHANVDSFQKSEAEEFIEGAMLLMNVVGIKIFEDTNTILRNRLINRTRKKKTETIEYLESNDAVLTNHVYYCSNAKDNRLHMARHDMKYVWYKGCSQFNDTPPKTEF